MARKTPYGKFIISAGEVGAYTVCPEAWRLRTIERVSHPAAANVEAGEQLHRQWAKSLDEALFLSRSTRAIILMLLAALIIYLAGQL